MQPKTIRLSIQDIIPTIKNRFLAGGNVELTVPGNSMKPTLLDRTSVVRLAGIADPKVGDMVLYRRDNGVYVLHRIVKTCSDGTYVLCGDAQYRLEKGIRRDQMIAVVVDFCRRKRWISCDNPLYRCWWKIWVKLRGWRHIYSALRRHGI